VERRISCKEVDGYPRVRVFVDGRWHWTTCTFMVQPPPRMHDMGLIQDLHDRGIWSGYEQYVVKLEPVLEEMGARGVPVSPTRHAEVKAELERRLNEADAAMQAFIPATVRSCTPKKGYKREPKDTTGMVQRWFAEDLNGFQNETLRWCRLNEWKPSHDGLLRYITHMKHPIPTDYKTGKQTTLEPELERLCRTTADPLYAAVLVYRQIGTILNNHMKNWTPGADGRVHPTWYYETGTGQLAARRPNTTNAPKHGEHSKKELADMFRSMIVAKEGHTLVELDFKSYHAQTLAFEANDADYLRLAKIDIHSYLTAHLVRHPDRDRLLGYKDEELAACLGRIKKEHRYVRDYKAKRAILGYGFGMGYRKLYNLNRESFDSQTDAKRVIDTLNGLFPRANKWRDEVRARAHEQGFLISRFGCIRWFWEVFKWSGGKWAPGGDDSEAAVAFLPSNDAFCHIKDALLRLQAKGLLERYRLINQIHDALMFEVPDNLVDEGIVTIASEMELPSKVMVGDICPGGLSVEVSVSRGKKWSEMEEIKWR